MAILLHLDEQPLYASLAPPGSTGVLIYPATSDGSSNGWNNPQINSALLVRPRVFVCPSDNSQPANNFLNPPTTTSSYALVLGSLGANANADELHQKYQNTGPFVYFRSRRSADVIDGLNNTIFVGETTAGDTPDSLNCWALSVAYLCSMRSTDNPLNSPPGSRGLVPITDNGLAGLPSQATGAFASQHPSGANFAFGDGHVKYIVNTIDFPTYQALLTIAGGEMINAANLTP